MRCSGTGKVVLELEKEGTIRSLFSIHLLEIYGGLRLQPEKMHGSYATSVASTERPPVIVSRLESLALGKHHANRQVANCCEIMGTPLQAFTFQCSLTANSGHSLGRSICPPFPALDDPGSALFTICLSC